jgi:hypothetical protein
MNPMLIKLVRASDPDIEARIARAMAALAA